MEESYARAIGRLIGSATVNFGIAFLLIGIVYQVGLRKYPKWKARFWCLTFALAGVISAFIGESRILGVLFGIVALIIYIVKVSASPLKKCPKCAEKVKAEAVICRYCRYEFPPPPPPEEQKMSIGEKINSETVNQLKKKWF